MPLKKYKIALVEDDLMLLKYLSTSLKANKNFEIFIASDGEKAIEVIFERIPDLVLLDIIIPKKNGFEVLEGIRKNQSLNAVKIIMLSNLGQASDREQALKLGATDYWVKVDMEVSEIVERVTNLLL